MNNQILALQAINLLLTVLPDTKEQDDPSWEHCWNELSDDAQEQVKEARCEAEELLPNLENKEETVVIIPSSVVEQLYDILLLEVFAVQVTYSSDALEMAQEAIANQKAGIEQALDLMNEHCPAHHLFKERTGE